jgi:transcriptional regulator GlxA family with amidase domain
MLIAILIYEKLTALDAIGPYEALAHIPGADVMLVAAGEDPVIVDTGKFALVPGGTTADIAAADALIVPGGEGNRPLMEDDRLLGWIRRVHEHTRVTASVCTGALLLGAAGLLEGKRATTHWAYRDDLLPRFGATPVAERVVRDGKVITAAGVSAGIELGLIVAAELFGEDAAKASELGIEYDPSPPFGTGSPERAPEEIVNVVRTLERGEGAGQ